MKRIVPRVRATVCVLFVAFSSFQSFSQSITLANGTTEIGLGLGPLIFLGDLGGNQGIGRTFVKDVNFPLTKLCKGVFVSVSPNEWLGFRVAVNQGVLEGNDNEAPDKGGEEEFRLHRRLSFKTNIIEGQFVAEFYPTVFFEKYEGLLGKFRPYGVIGGGVYHFNPKTQDNSGNWVALRPLHTEGEGFAEYPNRKEYSLTQFEIPMGVGFKFYVKENMYIGLEIIHRKLFTDYVDDVSTTYIDPSLFDKYLTPANAAEAKQLNYRGDFAQFNTDPGSIVGSQRGDPKQNDAFFSTIIRMGWRLNSNRDKGAVHQLHCPKFY